MTNATGKGDRRKLHPPFAQPDPGRRADPTDSVEIPGDAAATELPADIPITDQSFTPHSSELRPIKEFVDELPSIEEFLDTRPQQRPAASATSPDTDEEGWAAGAWQSYDWSGIASLGAPEPEAIAANAEWSSTDWDASPRGSSEVSRRVTPVQVAAALDAIAQRIRNGELSLDTLLGTPPEAAIAAAFAAVLRTRG